MLILKSINQIQSQFGRLQRMPGISSKLGNKHLGFKWYLLYLRLFERHTTLVLNLPNDVLHLQL